MSTLPDQLQQEEMRQNVVLLSLIVTVLGHTPELRQSVEKSGFHRYENMLLCSLTGQPLNQHKIPDG